VARHHVFLSPGMFGFGKLGSYVYFAHIERELAARFAAAGHELSVHIVEDLPTASIRRRAHRLAERVAATPGDGAIHLLGHSTGGLDARLVASPATRGLPDAHLAWLPRLRSVTTMNTPHFGTPLASFFATAQGQRVLGALSLLTLVGLSVGAQPLAAASVLLGFVRNTDRALPFKLALLERSLAPVVSLVDDARSPEIRKFVAAIEDDQGSMLQLSPEAMDLVAASFADRPGVVYQATISSSPPPRARRFLAQVTQPWRNVSLSLFYALHKLTAGGNPRYPCAAMQGEVAYSDPDTESLLVRAFGRAPGITDNDGIVPLRSQLWGRVVWAGVADHLDVLGHYTGDARRSEIVHRDWLVSGSEFGDRTFAQLCDAIAAGMLAAAD
jgi:triacylglycerol lipase